LGDPIVDHFPVFESDGYTKKTGESIFYPSIWKEGVVQTPVSTVSEIGTSGEYLFTFIPPQKGHWSYEVLINYNKEIWAGQVQVGGEDVVWGASMGDDGQNAVFGLWLEQDGERRMDIDSISAKLMDTQGNLIVDLGSNSTPTAEGVFEFSTPSTNLAQQVPYLVAASATDGTQTWDNNLGVVKSD
jgi:hypothetical protein